MISDQMLFSSVVPAETSSPTNILLMKGKITKGKKKKINYFIFHPTLWHSTLRREQLAWLEDNSPKLYMRLLIKMTSARHQGWISKFSPRLVYHDQPHFMLQWRITMKFSRGPFLHHWPMASLWNVSKTRATRSPSCNCLHLCPKASFMSQQPAQCPMLQLRVSPTETPNNTGGNVRRKKRRRCLIEWHGLCRDYMSNLANSLTFSTFF